MEEREGKEEVVGGEGGEGREEREGRNERRKVARGGRKK